MVWVLVTASGHPGQTVPVQGACRDCPSFPRMCGGLRLHNKMHLTSLGINIHLGSKSDQTPMALASPGYCLESFSPEGSEQMRFISVVTCKSYPRIQLGVFYHKLLHKIPDLMLEWLGSASLSIRPPTPTPRPADVPQ